VETIFPAHLDYLNISSQEVSPQLRNLDLGFMRGIGGFIVAVGIGSLTLLYTSVKMDNRLALWGMLLMITIDKVSKPPPTKQYKTSLELTNFDPINKNH